MKLKNNNFHLDTYYGEKSVIFGSGTSESQRSERKQFLCVQVRGGFLFSQVILKRVKKEMA